jgi:mannose-6-phosphate isomerase-like protein (cupin superfamily)
MIRFIARGAPLLGVLCALTNPVSAEELTVLTELHRADLTGVADTEVILSNFVVKPGGKVPLHTHHGDEFYVVVQGTSLTTNDGKIVEVKDGIATSYPRGTVHGGVTNSGDRDLVLTITHIVDKGKPLITIVE